MDTHSLRPTSPTSARSWLLLFPNYCYMGPYMTLNMAKIFKLRTIASGKVEDRWVRRRQWLRWDNNIRWKVDWPMMLRDIHWLCFSWAGLCCESDKWYGCVLQWGFIYSCYSYIYSCWGFVYSCWGFVFSCFIILSTFSLVTCIILYFYFIFCVFLYCQYICKW